MSIEAPANVYFSVGAVAKVTFLPVALLNWNSFLKVLILTFSLMAVACNTQFSVILIGLL